MIFLIASIKTEYGEEDICNPFDNKDRFFFFKKTEHSPSFPWACIASTPKEAEFCWRNWIRLGASVIIKRIHACGCYQIGPSLKAKGCLVLLCTELISPLKFVCESLNPPWGCIWRQRLREVIKVK